MNTFERLCRSCSSEGEFLHNFFETKLDDEFLVNVYGVLCSIQVTMDDSLPQNICSVCFDALVNFNKFKNNCIKTENKLKAMKLDYDEKRKEETLKLEKLDNVSEDSASEPELRDETDYDSSSSEDAKPLSTWKQNILTKSIRRHKQNTAKRKASKRNNTELSKPESCRDCGETFSFRVELQKHCRMYGHKKDRSEVCDVCNKKVTQLKAHMLSHTKEKPFQCTICDERFVAKYNMKRHMMRHTGERPHVCETCGAGFIQSCQLTEHKRLHTGEQPFICDHCGEKFATTNRYKSHLRKHLTEEQKLAAGKFSCDICHKELSSKGNLKHHLMTHGEKTFLCSECGKSFSTKESLDTHFRSHTGERPFACSFCDKTFSHRTSWRYHQMLHNGLRPHVCNICSKAFSQKHHLRYHIRKHNGEKPYVCSFCGKAFIYDDSLKKHLRTHTGEGLTCNLCFEHYSNTSSLKKHKANCEMNNLLSL